MKHWGKALIGLIVTVALLRWALAGVTVSEVSANIRQGNPWLLLAAVFLRKFGVRVGERRVGEGCRHRVLPV